MFDQVKSCFYKRKLDIGDEIDGPPAKRSKISNNLVVMRVWPEYHFDGYISEESDDDSIVELLSEDGRANYPLIPVAHVQPQLNEIPIVNNSFVNPLNRDPRLRVRPIETSSHNRDEISNDVFANGDIILISSDSEEDTDVDDEIISISSGSVYEPNIDDDIISISSESDYDPNMDNDIISISSESDNGGIPLYEYDGDEPMIEQENQDLLDFLNGYHAQGK